MKIKMLETRRGTEDGFKVQQYLQGEQYDVRDGLGHSFIRSRFAEHIKEEKVYRGFRSDDASVVTVNNSILNPRYDLRNHSPCGFAWGYGGSGPAQLALAILADVAGDKQAIIYYQTFKLEIIGNLPKQWSLTETEVKKWLSDKQEENERA